MKAITKFYTEKVLTRKDLDERYLPYCPNGVKIDHRLFEWRLYYSPKKYIEAKSEYEARYLKVWIEAQASEIKVPKDEEYLKTIVPELEKIKKDIDKVVEEELAYVLSYKVKRQILQRVWTKLREWEEEYDQV